MLRTEITVAGLAFHHAVRGAHDDLTATIDRQRQTTANGDFAYYVDIATAMSGLPRTSGSAIQWLDDAHTVQERWRDLVMSRRRYLQSAR
ncbi:hypothetical protein [Streptomyces lydicus]|uniref:hypothetical protein n=1 Tax=Streptomyces lydicus TaxID=47763 RepID=UPI001582F73E|nr:hypothetical protein [Streptomyces lydicus]